MTAENHAYVKLRCPGHNRHWFTQRGAPTMRLPRCVRCGAPNPKWSDQRPDMVLSLGESHVAALERGWNGEL